LPHGWTKRIGRGLRGLAGDWFGFKLPAGTAFFRKDIPVALNPLTVVVGDFNGDHRPDLAVTSWEGIFILLNEGAGNLGRPIRTDVNVDLLFVGDFNGDGKDDLLTNRGLLMLSRGDGTFLPPRTVIDVAAQGTIRAAGDLNRDGNLDLLVGGDVSIGAPTDEGLRAWLGNGEGTFRLGELITSLRAHAANLNKPGVTDRVRQVVVADFNRDGRTDLGILPVSNPLLPFMVLLGWGWDIRPGGPNRNGFIERSLGRLQWRWAA
jgi:hypothetical protein